MFFVPHSNAPPTLARVNSRARKHAHNGHAPAIRADIKSSARGSFAEPAFIFCQQRLAGHVLTIADLIALAEVDVAGRLP
jgi:hypothetical protein